MQGPRLPGQHNRCVTALLVVDKPAALALTPPAEVPASVSRTGAFSLPRWPAHLLLRADPATACAFAHQGTFASTTPCAKTTFPASPSRWPTRQMAHRRGGCARNATACTNLRRSRCVWVTNPKCCLPTHRHRHVLPRQGTQRTCRVARERHLAGARMKAARNNSDDSLAGRAATSEVTP